MLGKGLAVLKLIVDLQHLDIHLDIEIWPTNIPISEYSWSENSLAWFEQRTENSLARFLVYRTVTVSFDQRERACFVWPYSRRATTITVHSQHSRTTIPVLFTQIVPQSNTIFVAVRAFPYQWFVNFFLFLRGPKLLFFGVIRDCENIQRIDIFLLWLYTADQYFDIEIYILIYFYCIISWIPKSGSTNSDFFSDYSK